MSLPEIRLVLNRAAAKEATRAALTGELTALSAACGSGSKQAASALTNLLQDLAWLADPVTVEEEISTVDFSAAFGALGIPRGEE